MKELDIQNIIDMNYRVTLLLGYASSIVMDYQRVNGSSVHCKWFFDAVQAVIYENKPLPPLPER